MTLTTTETNETTETDELLEETETAAAELVSTAFRVGRLWATHGLTVADRTLQAAADTLETTAKTLADLSRRIDGESAIDEKR